MFLNTYPIILCSFTFSAGKMHRERKVLFLKTNFT